MQLDLVWENPPSDAMVAEVVLCANCGTSLPPYGGIGRMRRFCSDQCRAHASNVRQNRRRNPMRDVNPEQRSCAHCGMPFIPGRRDQIYCSNESRYPYCAVLAYQARKRTGQPLRQVQQQKMCGECGKQFTAYKSNALWCSMTCKNRDTNRRMGRNRYATTVVERYADREIFIRDNWICHLCGYPIDPALPRTNWGGATIDHIVALSKGGTDSPGNVAAAHWFCNHKKRTQAK